MTTQRDLSLILFTFLTGALSVVNGWDVSAVAGDAIVGQQTTFKCVVTDVAFNNQNNPNKLPVASSIEILSGNVKYVSYSFPIALLAVSPSTVNSRYSYDIATRTITIQGVECSDEKTFSCVFTVFEDGSGRVSKSSQAKLVVKVPPKVPNPMSAVPANLTENSSVSATCNANTGRPQRGRIQWRIYRNNAEQILEASGSNKDGITITTSETSPSPTDDNCTVRTISTLRINKVAVSDQNLVLTCFVLNDDFPKNPSNCDSAEVSLCQQSETIRIHYSVRDIKVSKVPDSDEIVEGRNVRLTCQASGFPDPKYQWSKIGDNRTLLGDMDGLTSQLILANVNEDNDSGNYSCTASNIVGATTHSQMSIVAIKVVKTPPTTTPDPIETTDPVGPTGSPAKKSDSGDDSTTVIIIVVVIVVAVIIAIIVGVCIYRKRGTKEDPPRPKDIPFYNNKQSMGGPPDVLGDDKKKPIGGSLNNSFDVKTEDGLDYANLTYDNRPRSRKPMAFGDTSSDYSDVQMPQV